jgi:hypothetical protein
MNAPTTSDLNDAYFWKDDNCAMCTELGEPFEATGTENNNETEGQSVNRGPLLHSLLHSHITPLHADDVVTKHNELLRLLRLNKYRAQEARAKNGSVLAWATILGLVHDSTSYRVSEKQDEYDLRGSGYSQA